MQSIEKRLQTIKYQILKPLLGTFSDDELIKMASGIYDSAINADTTISEQAVFPISALGVAIKWEEDNKRFVLERGTQLMYDSLEDETIPEPFSQDVEPVLGVEDDYLILSTGEFLSIN